MKLVLTGILFFCLAATSTAQEVLIKQLISRNTGTKVLADGSSIRVAGFAEALGAQPDAPGPTLYFTEGDSINLELFNLSQGPPHTIHLHGLDVDQQNDGVPHLSFELAHRETGNYYFVAPHSGSYLYHCHVVSTIHVQAGMYGMLIVRPKDEKTAWTDGPAFDKEFAFLTSEIDVDWHTDSVLLHPYSDTGKVVVEIPEYNPTHFLINGAANQQLAQNNIYVDMAVDKIGLIRLANIGFLGNQIIFPASLNAEVISSDGRPLPSFEKTDTLMIFPGERYQVLIKPTSIFTDSISFNYINMNTLSLDGVQKLRVDIAKTSSVNELNEAVGFDVYPNPSQTVVHVSLGAYKTKPILIDVIDAQGRNVFAYSIKDDLHNNELILNLDLMSGIYYIKATFDDGSFAIEKLMMGRE